jgi:large subunit ribosomal protein L32
MIEPKKKVSKARKRRRFSANAYAKTPVLVECSHCHAKKEAHRVCPVCGFYDGKQVVVKKEESK